MRDRSGRPASQQDELYKVQFEASAETRRLLGQTGRIIVAVGRARDEKVLPCEVLPFAMPRHANRIAAPAGQRSQGQSVGRRLKKRLKGLRLFLVLRPFESLLQIFARFFQSTERIVVGLDGLPVFVDGAFALARDVEDLSQLDMAPDFRPARIAIPVDGGAVRICRRLVVSLQVKNLCNAVMGQ